jgi:RNA polymerase sigma factor (sigma-70 family)
VSGILVSLLNGPAEGRLQRFFQRRLGSRDDAADATQETLLRMLVASRSTLIDDPQAYLFQVARSVANAAITRQMRDRALFVTDDDALGTACEDLPDQHRILLGRQHLRLMARAISALPNRCQQVFILSRLHGFSNGAIATELGISRNMVEKHIIRALLHCRTLRAEIFR